MTKMLEDQDFRFPNYVIDFSDHSQDRVQRDISTEELHPASVGLDHRQEVLLRHRPRGEVRRGLHLPGPQRRGLQPLDGSHGRKGAHVRQPAKARKCSPHVFRRGRIRIHYQVRAIHLCFLLRRHFHIKHVHSKRFEISISISLSNTYVDFFGILSFIWPNLIWPRMAAVRIRSQKLISTLLSTRKVGQYSEKLDFDSGCCIQTT